MRAARPIKVRKKEETDRRTDGRQIVTLLLPLDDVASVKYDISLHNVTYYLECILCV